MYLKDQAEVSLVGKWVNIRRRQRSNRKGSDGLIVYCIEPRVVERNTLPPAEQVKYVTGEFLIRNRISPASFQRLMRLLTSGWRHSRIGTVAEGKYDHFEYLPYSDDPDTMVFLELLEIRYLHEVLDAAQTVFKAVLDNPQQVNVEDIQAMTAAIKVILQPP